MRHALDGDEWSDDLHGSSSHSVLGPCVLTWLRDPKATNFTGTLFLLFDVVLPVVFLIFVILVKSAFPGRHSMSVEVCATPSVHCPDRVRRSLTWWSKTQVAAFVWTNANPEMIELIPPPWSLETLSEVLCAYGISTIEWDESAMQFLLDELSTGRARLQRKDYKPLRVVDLVLLVVEFAPEKCILQEAPDEAVPDAVLERIPYTRRIMGESLRVTAWRCLEEQLSIPGEVLKVHDNPINIIDSVEISDGLPNLPSCVRKFVMHVEVIPPSSTATLRSMGLQSADTPISLGWGGLQRYEWASSKISPLLIQHLRRSSTFRIRWTLEQSDVALDPQRSILDSSFKAILPWTEKAVQVALEAHRCTNPADRFGREARELAAELSSGQCTLGLRLSDARMLCVQDVYSLLVAAPGGAILVDVGVKGPGEDPPAH